MKFKIVSIVLFCILAYTSFTKAASWSKWSASPLTPNHSVYVYTNNVTSITIDVICTRSMLSSGSPETGFSLPFAVGSTSTDGSTLNIYSTFNITAADFENYATGSLYLDYKKTITIDSRTQSLGNGRFTLYDYTTPYAVDDAIYTPSYPFIYIANVGTFDQFPSSYSSTQFNYNFGPRVSATEIRVSNTQPVLTVGQSIYSPSQNHRLTLQADGNLVLYTENAGGTETAIWASNTSGKASASLYFQTDGNLVIYPGTNTPNSHVSNSAIWASNINASGFGTVTQGIYCLQDDGNFVFLWPNYFSYTGFVDVIMGASDSQSGASAHFGNLNHPLWSPTLQQTAGSSFTPTPQ